MVFGDDPLFNSLLAASRFNPMYRHQQQQANGYPVPGSPAGAPPGTVAVPGWFQTATTGYHPHVPHQGSPEAAAAAAAAAATGTAYCMNEHQMWPHHPIYPTGGGDFTDFHQQHHQQQQLLQDGHHHHHHHHNHHQHQDMSATAGSSPPMTISGSDMSAGSPGTPGVGPVSPHLPSQAGRPPPVRSPYDWMKKSAAYQNQQPNPESGGSEPVLLDFGDSLSALSILGKTRTKDKYRVVYTDHQRVELEKEFYYSRYITIRRKAELANNLGLSERQVKIWFQNRRAKERKQVKKREEFSHKDSIMNINHMTQQTQQQMHQQLSPGILPVTMM